MPESNRPLVERIARVLAGAALSSNAEGSDPSAGAKVDHVWPEHVNQALAVLHTMREAGRADGRRRRRRHVAQDGRGRDRANGSIEPARHARNDCAGRSALDLSSPASSRRACRSSRARSSTLRLPAIRESYGAEAQQVQWVVNAYLLPLSALLLLGGALGDHFGRRRLLVIGTAMFAVDFPRLCARAEPRRSCSPRGPRRALARRCCCPTAWRCSMPLSPARSAAAPSASGPPPGAAAAAVAPLIGGWLVDTVGWPAIFYINLPLALGAIVLASRFVSESREAGAGRTDYAGALLATAGLGGLTYALTLWSATRQFTTCGADRACRGRRSWSRRSWRSSSAAAAVP